MVEAAQLVNQMHQWPVQQEAQAAEETEEAAHEHQQRQHAACCKGNAGQGALAVLGDVRRQLRKEQQAEQQLRAQKCFPLNQPG
mmetsp:Transcript_95620/g.175765  ORF Transcript_95620/g.175765 Transcript_95620/m.175765 type:complete len:84 (+) Transcript_95620:245-496(+)